MNQHWADLIVEELVRCGVGLFCLAPGSRSTPLTVAVARHPEARHVVHFDERGTAFMALGYARATGRPAAWITTSGTAVANGLPAVVEASVDGVPLVLLTADRPPELRDTGANQTIDQVKLFEGYIRWQFDLPVPDAAIDPAMVLTTVDQAVYRSRRTPAGPVHLNCMFREPLAPPTTQVPLAGHLSGWREGGRPYTTYAPTRTAADADVVARLWAGLRTVERGLVVAGRLATPAQGDAVRRAAESLGWPLLPDAASQVRYGAPGAPAVPYYDLLLGDPGFAGAHAPEAVLQVGGRSVSKPLLQFLDRARPACYAVVDESPGRQDPRHHVTHRIEADVIAFCDALAGAAARLPRDEDPAGWRGAWHEASAAVGRHLDAFFSDRGAISEPAVARAVTRLLPVDHGLCLAASMPVRDADAFGVPDGAPAFVATNRGASGIDGTVATAAGVAAGRQSPATLLIGDLALLHDLNALALLGRHPVVLVVINNHGGGIFQFLPIAAEADVFEPFFGTPHDRGFEHAAALFGLPYARPETMADFEVAYLAACAGGGSAVIEVVTDRNENADLHRALRAEVGALLS